MRKLTIALSLGIGCMIVGGVRAQQLMELKPKKPIVCYQKNVDSHDHIGVSETFRDWRKNEAARTKNANIEVEYINFPSNNLAKNAFQYAVEIWESQVKSPMPIRIRAEWASLSPGVLGSAIWGAAYANFNGAQYLNTFYPVALAEKIARRELNNNGVDISATFSSNTNWYYGTDANTPAGQTDLVTVVLHEIAHGLGFTDSYSVEAGVGRVGLEADSNFIPIVFDLFIENNADQNLYRSFSSPSVQLRTQLTSNNLFFDSPLAVEALNGNRPKIYAPASYDEGSSISHLNESTFNQPGDANKLMTPQIATAESIHQPGNLLLAMFSDMGWVFTKIEHEPLKDTERQDGAPYIITATINSDNGYDAGEVKLHYTSDGTNFTVLNMIATGIANQFSASLPGTTQDKSYGYFISVEDVINRIFTAPGKIQAFNTTPTQRLYVVNIGPDESKPEIVHAPPDFILEEDDALALSADVTDNLGVREVVIEYKINGGNLQTFPMQKQPGTDTYTFSITLPALTIGQYVEYRIIARDDASVENVAFNPEADFHRVSVFGILPAQNVYINNFNTSSADFVGNSFSITTPTGFSDGAIHSKHPYDNGSGPNDESNYVYQLQIPIRINRVNPFIRFDEIVLVEPGEDGSVFGDLDFFDYVIVEGSKDRGATWFRFLDGYDSRAQSIWLSRYNENISNNNSQTVGQPSLFKERTINMLASGAFSHNDEVLIRFRLFADQAARGWGWAIDNLNIQSPITDVEQTVSNDFAMYPVPVRNTVTIEYASSQPHSFVEVVNAMGQIVYKTGLSAVDGRIKGDLHLQGIEEGVYILRIKSPEKTLVKRFVKIND